MADSGRDPILHGVDLVKHYTAGGVTTRALDGVTVAVPRGRFVSVMGPSGSGKSTLLHVLGGLDRPTSGEVTVDGRAMSGLSDRELTLLRRYRLGFVFQAFNLVPVLSAADNIALPAIIDGARPEDYAERLEHSLSLVDLEAHRTKLPAQLSGGQQQRVAIARALFMAPAVLLADEPTGNLDTRSGTDVLDLLRSAQTELGTTIVMVTHDPRSAATGDEVVMLRDGLLVGRLLFSPRSATPLEDTRDLRTARVLAWLQEMDVAPVTPVGAGGPEPACAG